MLQSLSEGFFLGLATGSTCLATCTPIYLPYLLSEERKIASSFLIITKISLGRFISYLAFGAIAGYLGANITGIDRNLFTSVAYILISIYLLISTFRVHKHGCTLPKAVGFTKSPFLLGIITGINFCPSFLLALSEAVNLSGVTAGILLFSGFFLGTTVFLLPLGFFGHFSRYQEMKTLAKIASLVVACWFIGKGVIGLTVKPSPTFNVLKKNTTYALVFSSENQAFAKTLADSLSKYGNITQPASAEVIFMDFSDTTAYADKDRIFISPSYPVGDALHFLSLYQFEKEGRLTWKFR